MSVLRAVADTNVLVAAAISPRGTCGRLLDAALEKRWTLVASPQLIAELGEVLLREKFRSWLPEDEASRVHHHDRHVHRRKQLRPRAARALR